jgi:tetratricopeptide (TPR) repeat protein
MMKKLEPADRHRLNAAEGWLELGNCREADAELEAIAPHLHAHPAILQMRWRLNAQAKKWDRCVEIASTLTRMMPADEQSLVNLGNSLYFSGRTKEAFDQVSAVTTRFPRNAILRYNLGCYACQLGMLDVAKIWLGEAFELDEKSELKRMALEDPDLKPLWEALRADWRC